MPSLNLSQIDELQFRKKLVQIENDLSQVEEITFNYVQSLKSNHSSEKKISNSSNRELYELNYCK